MVVVLVRIQNKNVTKAVILTKKTTYLAVNSQILKNVHFSAINSTTCS